MISRGLWKSVAFALWASVGTASATTTSSFIFDERLAGRRASPSTPWITATFVDLSANTVGLSISAPGLVNHQSVGTIYLYVGKGTGPLGHHSLGSVGDEVQRREECALRIGQGQVHQAAL